jgi:RNA polymerase sigma factor (sigma-70 family)
MSTPPAGSLVRHLRRLLPPAGLAALTDRQLLERFAAVRDEAAFAALVERHGRLILGVCRRLLGDAHEAEDVFQATFLVLARKADALRRPDAVASFLHGVAARLARKARSQRERRRFFGPREVPTSPDVPAAVARDEVCRVVDEELRRLPAHYRTPLVLCYLEGKSRQEAAAVLGCSEGAVKGKLERGRELLRARLVRRGVAAVPAALAALEQPVGAAPAAWMAAAVQTAMDGGRLTGAAAALADGLLRGMVAAKMKVAVGVLLLCAAGLAVGLAARSEDAQPRTDGRGEPLPAGAVARLGDAPLVRDAPILFVGFARKGQTITAQQGFTAYCTTCHADPFNPMEAPPLDADSFRVWDLEHGRELRHFGTAVQSPTPNAVRAEAGAVRPGSPPAVCVALSPDGQSLAVGCGGIELRKGKRMQFDPITGKKIETGLVQIWDTAGGRLARQFTLPSDKACAALAFTPDGKQLAVYDDRGILSTWDPATGREMQQFAAADRGSHPAWGDTVAFSPDGQTVAVSSTGPPGKPPAAVLRLLDRAGKERCRIRDKAPGCPAVAFSPDSRSLAYAATDGKVRLADAATGKEVRTLGDPQRTSFLAALAFSPDGKTLATRGYDQAIRLWDAASGREVRQLTLSLLSLQTGTARRFFGPEFLSPAGTLAFSPDGKFLAAADPAGRARLWEVATGAETHTGHAGAVTAIDFTSGGRAVRSLGSDRTVRQWRPGSGEQTARFQLPAGAADAILSPGGKVAAFSIARDKVLLWDVEAGREILRIEAPMNSPGCIGCVAPRTLAFSPDGKWLARWSSGGIVRVWDAASGRKRHTLTPPQWQEEHFRLPEEHTGVSFSPDGTLLAALRTARGKDPLPPSVCIWDLADGRLLRHLDGLPAGIASLAFAPDGRTLALGHDTGEVSTRELASGRQRAVIRSGPDRPVSVLAYSPDGKVLAGAKDRRVYFWDVRTGKELETRQGHSLEVVSAAFSPDGRTLVSGSKDSTALVWDVVGLRPDPKPVSLNERELAACWQALPGDAERAWVAMNRLAAAPSQAVALLREQLRPASVDAGRIDRRIADLEDAEFAVRERASAELEKLGELAGPAIRRALAANPPLESRRRLEALREKLDGRKLSAETLRAIRAAELLEQINSPEARALLERLAGGAPGTTLTREARAALDRLRRATPP